MQVFCNFFSKKIHFFAKKPQILYFLGNITSQKLQLHPKNAHSFAKNRNVSKRIYETLRNISILLFPLTLTTLYPTPEFPQNSYIIGLAILPTLLTESDKIYNEKSLLTSPYFFRTPSLPSHTEPHFAFLPFSLHPIFPKIPPSFFFLVVTPAGCRLKPTPLRSAPLHLYCTIALFFPSLRFGRSGGGTIFSLEGLHTPSL